MTTGRSNLQLLLIVSSLCTFFPLVVLAVFCDREVVNVVHLYTASAKRSQ